MVYNPMGNGGGLVGGGIPSGMFSPARKKRGGSNRLPVGKAARFWENGDPDDAQELVIANADYTGLDLVPDSSVTFEAWIKPRVMPTEQVLIGHSSLSTHGYQWTLLGGSVGQSGLKLTYTSGSILIDLDAAGFSVLPDVWNHVALTRNAVTGTGEAFVNGVSAGVDSDGSGGTSDFALRSYAVHLARQTHKDVARYGGSLAEVRIWHRVRTADEILENYNRTLEGTELGLMAYYRFDDNFEDSSPNLNHLTNSSAPLVTIQDDSPI